MIRAGLNIDHEEFPRAKIKEVKYCKLVSSLQITLQINQCNNQ